MGIAKLTAGRSKDPNTQVGACIVSSDNRVLSMLVERTILSSVIDSIVCSMESAFLSVIVYLAASST